MRLLVVQSNPSSLRQAQFFQGLVKHCDLVNSQVPVHLYHNPSHADSGCDWELGRCQNPLFCALKKFETRSISSICYFSPPRAIALAKRAGWDSNPRFAAPQAAVLVLARLPALRTEQNPPL